MDLHALVHGPLAMRMKSRDKSHACIRKVARMGLVSFISVVHMHQQLMVDARSALSSQGFRKALRRSRWPREYATDYRHPQNYR